MDISRIDTGRCVMAQVLTDLQEAAALAEMVYRRNPADQAIDIVGTGGKIPGTDLDLTANPPQGLTPAGGSGYYYDNATGFVGRVVETESADYVIFRGTDMAGGF